MCNFTLSYKLLCVMFMSIYKGSSEQLCYSTSVNKTFTEKRYAYQTALFE